MPSPRSVARWRDAVPPGFRFCLKLPRTITHERLLRDADALLAGFLRAVAPLGPRLGPFLVQLPPSFGPDHLPDLRRFLAALPRGHDYSVELRHRAFFEDADLAAACDALLIEHGASRCVLDARALRAGDPDHPEVRAALHEKPDLPLQEMPVGHRPLVRFVGHPDPVPNEPFLEEWAARVAGWLADGREPYVFVHTASNRRTPEVARDLHRRIAKRVEVGALPSFPGESGERADGQLRLL